MEILIKQEMQAYLNIGDAALLMGKFNIDEEEEITAEAIEKGLTAEAFEEEINKFTEEFNPFELLMKHGDKGYIPRIKNNETMYNDIDYLNNAISFFSEKKEQAITQLKGVQGVEVELTDEMRRRLDAVLPDEAKSKNNYLRLTPDKDFCMEQITESLKKNLSETSWQSTQYLWRLHPIFDWINEKANLLYPRGVAPLIGIEDAFPKGESAYVLSGIIPNRKSTPVVDVFICLHYDADGNFKDEWTMRELLSKTGFGKKDTPNKMKIKDIADYNTVPPLKDIIDKAKKIMLQRSKKYKERIDPLIFNEHEKLGDLQKNRNAVIERTYHDSLAKEIKMQETYKLFETFVDFVTETLDIENEPYLKVVTCIRGL
jgi:hypothetical protein